MYTNFPKIFALSTEYFLIKNLTNLKVNYYVLYREIHKSGNSSRYATKTYEKSQYNSNCSTAFTGSNLYHYFEVMLLLNILTLSVVVY